MSENPKLAKILGVEPYELFHVGAVKDFPLYVNEFGDLKRYRKNGGDDYADCATLCALIQHPDYVTPYEATK